MAFMVYQEDDGDLSHLNEKLVGVIGYGNLGRPVALNLRDSGVRVIIGTHSDDGRRDATADGFSAFDLDEAVKKAQVNFILMPNEVMVQAYIDQIAPYLRRGSMLVFSSAYNVTFGYIEPPPFVDVGLLAPRIMAAGVREKFLSGEGYLSYLSIAQDARGEAWPVLLALAKGIGALKAGGIEITFEREAELDLFAQQTVLPLLYQTLTTAVGVLLDKGYPTDIAFAELYLSGELSYFFERMAESGLQALLQRQPQTTQYGALSRLERFFDNRLERLMELTLEEIRSGAFAREWTKENVDGLRRLKLLWKNQNALDIWDFEKQALDSLGREVED
ncbi:MAG: NAD(P)-binding domain-containing protein [Anaerolineae bacterium]|nr:NAD(P)-binding domain-containing protein [Anaerolineae bacterium]